MSSTNQFFIVIQEIQRCRWTFCGHSREGNLHPGTVIVIKPRNGENEFEVHRGTPLGAEVPTLVTREGGLPRDKVASITDQEFDILLGSNYSGDPARFQLYTSDRLNWTCQLNVGDEVQVKIGDKRGEVPGVIRGSAARLLRRLDYGLQFIVEITVNLSCALTNNYFLWLCPR